MSQFNSDKGKQWSDSGLVKSITFTHDLTFNAIAYNISKLGIFRIELISKISTVLEKKHKSIK